MWTFIQIMKVFHLNVFFSATATKLCGRNNTTDLENEIIWRKVFTDNVKEHLQTLARLYRRNKKNPWM